LAFWLSQSLQDGKYTEKVRSSGQKPLTPPSRLLKHGKTEDAAQIMGRLQSVPSDDPQIQKDIEEINDFNAASQGRKLGIKEFLGNGSEMNLWRAAAACGSQACQQISGQ